MSIGGGKYDAEALELLERLQADGIVLLVTGGPRGEGFEVQVTDLALMRALPAALRGAAAMIEIDLGLTVLTRLDG